MPNTKQGAADVIAELRRLHEKATAPPWESYEPHGQDTIWLDIVAGTDEEILSAETLYIGQKESPEHVKSQANIALVVMLRNKAKALLDIAEAVVKFVCPECNGKGEILDPMAWHDAPENYLPCAWCAPLRAALAKLTEES